MNHVWDPYIPFSSQLMTTHNINSLFGLSYHYSLAFLPLDSTDMKDGEPIITIIFFSFLRQELRKLRVTSTKDDLELLLLPLPPTTPTSQTLVLQTRTSKPPDLDLFLLFLVISFLGFLINN